MIIKAATPRHTLVDLQVNGITVISDRGAEPLVVDFSMPDLTLEHVRQAVTAWRTNGLSHLVPTIITAPVAVMLKNAGILAQAMGQDWGRGILGVHLEGPFLSPDISDAHPKTEKKEPDVDLFMRMFEEAQGKVAWTTVSPALKGAPDFISKVVELGVVVSIGHHSANTAQIEEAFAAGATGLTHAGNVWKKEDWGPKSTEILAQLLTDGVYAMVVADGEHVPLDFIKYVYKARGPEHFILVSDASPLAFAPKGNYRIFCDLDAVVKESEKTGELRTEPLSGSYQGLPRCIDFIEEWGIMPTADIVKAVWDNPLRFLKPALDRLGFDNLCG